MQGQALRSTGYKCEQCESQFGWYASCLDHIRPVSEFSSFEQANTLDNVQMLCPTNHREKTRTKCAKVVER